MKGLTSPGRICDGREMIYELRDGRCDRGEMIDELRDGMR